MSANGEAEAGPLSPPGERVTVRGGQRKTREVNVLTQRAREMGKNPTLAEKLLWSRLRNQRNGIVFRRQQVIGGYIVELYCSLAKLVIELDGWSHDDTYAYDEARAAWLEKEG